MTRVRHEVADVDVVVVIISVFHAGSVSQDGQRGDVEEGRLRGEW